jgi:ABC-type nitrate/sulfonate/bicarbonate transport system permease component
MTLLWRTGAMLVALAIVGLWGAVASFRLVSPVFLPSPSATIAALWDGLVHGDLLALTISTIRRMIVGWILASLAGIALGALIGTSRAAGQWLMPSLEVLRPLPASSLLPVGIALFGLTPGMLLATIAFGSIWPVLLATVHGFTSVDHRLHEVARVLRLSRLDFAVKLGLPNAAPDILAGLRLSLTASLIVTVVGEMLTAQNGLGTTILMAGRTFRSTDLYAGVILLGLVGAFNNALLGFAEQHLLAWRRV